MPRAASTTSTTSTPATAACSRRPPATTRRSPSSRSPRASRTASPAPSPLERSGASRRSVVARAHLDGGDVVEHDQRVEELAAFDLADDDGVIADRADLALVGLAVLQDELDLLPQKPLQVVAHGLRGVEGWLREGG